MSGSPGSKKVKDEVGIIEMMLSVFFTEDLATPGSWYTVVRGIPGIALGVYRISVCENRVIRKRVKFLPFSAKKVNNVRSPAVSVALSLVLQCLAC